MSDKLSKRQEIILFSTKVSKKYALNEIQTFFTETEKPAPATLRRDLADLVKKGYLEQSGERRGTRYRVTYQGLLNTPITPKDYLVVDIDKRNGNTDFTFDLFKYIPSTLFSEEIKEILDGATNTYREKSKNASKIIREKELERFVIELSWKSSEIEGNTYTLLDTERLIKEGVEASGHTRSEAIMILNHKKAFQYILGHPLSALSVRGIEDVHSILIENLEVKTGLRANQVGITGSRYIPLSVPSQLKEALEELCVAINDLSDPYSKALFALVGISYIQPFEDGNKRTARLIANSLLLAYDCAPLSYRGIDAQNYLESMLVFYEKNSLLPMKDIFITQYLFSAEYYLQFSI